MLCSSSTWATVGSGTWHDSLYGGLNWLITCSPSPKVHLPREERAVSWGRCGGHRGGRVPEEPCTGTHTKVTSTAKSTSTRAPIASEVLGGSTVGSAHICKSFILCIRSTVTL